MLIYLFAPSSERNDTPVAMSIHSTQILVSKTILKKKKKKRMEEPGFSREISVTKTGAGNMLDGPKTSCCVTLGSKDVFKKQ